MLVLITYDVNTETASGKKRLRKVAKECQNYGHKSQGSEFPAVILPAAQVPPRLCYRNLFYTGVTRGRKLCIVVGRRDVVNRMMSNIRQNLRYSGLAALLAQALLPEQENL